MNAIRTSARGGLALAHEGVDDDAVNLGECNSDAKSRWRGLSVAHDGVDDCAINPTLWSSTVANPTP